MKDLRNGFSEIPAHPTWLDGEELLRFISEFVLHPQPMYPRQTVLSLLRTMSVWQNDFWAMSDVLRGLSELRDGEIHRVKTFLSSLRNQKSS